MFIEVIHNEKGDIISCWAANTLPEGGGDAPLASGAQLSAGTAQARINIDTLTAMEIDQKCGQKAIIVNGAAKIVFIPYAQYIAQNFKVDVTKEVPIPIDVTIPAGMKVRVLIRN